MVLVGIFEITWCNGGKFWRYRANSNQLKKAGINTPRKDNAPLLQCTHHMCPVRVHWHVKLNYREYWRVKIAITNFNYRMNYTQWTLVAQHPNLNNVTQVFSFDYKPLVPYQSISELHIDSNLYTIYMDSSESNKYPYKTLDAWKGNDICYVRLETYCTYKILHKNA